MQIGRAELVELCRSLLMTPSLSGHEDGVAGVISAAMEKYGYDEVFRDKNGNLIGVIQGERPGKTVVMDGHMDTVDISDIRRWTHDPYGGETDGVRIYGRGASDMKGAITAMVLGAARFAYECKKNFAGRICVSCSVHEECFEGVATREVSRLCRPDYVIIGEATNLTLKTGQRGRAEIIVETTGRTCHSSNPEKGVNAVKHMCRLMERIEALPVIEHTFLGKGILELTDIISSPYPGSSVLPGKCRVTYDRRLLVGETCESILEPIKNIIAELTAQIPEFKAECHISRGRETCYTGEVIDEQRFFPAWLMDTQHELVQKALVGLHGAGLEAPISHYSFCTNGSHFCGEAGIPTIGFGPSLESLAHTIDEYIDIEQLCLAQRGYCGILKELMD